MGKAEVGDGNGWDEPRDDLGDCEAVRLHKCELMGK